MNKILLLVFSLAMMFTSAHGADWKFYGSARVQTFVENYDNGNLADSQTYYDQYLQSNSRVGARVKVSEELTARFEYGTEVNVRILYGEWNFGSGSLLVGQTYSPLNMFYSNQVWWDDTNLFDFGGVYSGRNPMLRLKFGEFQIAVVQPSTESFFGGSTEVKIPKIEAKYMFSKENWHLQIAGGYNSFNVFSGGYEFDVDSYVVALGGGINIGALYIQGSIRFGQNVGNYGLLNLPFDFAVFDWENDSHAYILVAGYKINDMFSIETGLGYTQAELDHPLLQKDAEVAYYFQSTITLAPGVLIIPEIGFIDWKTDMFGNNEGNTVYGGIKWQIDF